MNEEEKYNDSANEIVEITEGEDESTMVFNFDQDTENVSEEQVEVDLLKRQDKKRKGPSKWSMLSKKQKTIIIVCSILVLLLIVGILLFFFVFKKDEELKPEEPKKDEPITIVEKENYRYEDGKLIFLDKSKNELGTYECENKDEDLCFVAFYSDEDDFDVAKYVYEDGRSIENRSDIINNNYALVYDNKMADGGSVKLYDIKENEGLGTYVLAKEIDEKKVILKNEKDKYGVMSFDDIPETIIEFKYDYLGYIPDSEKLVGQKSLNYYLINMAGEEVSKSIPGEIKNFNNQYISAIVDKDYYLYDYKGKKVLEDEFDYITFKDGYVGAIESKKMYLFDSDANVLNMEGVRIKESNYNTKVVFDENKVQKEKTEAFKLSTTKDKITIEYGDEFTEINVNEGRLSKDLEYINYFEGKLYIYNDKEKTNLIGEYACSNANIIDSSTTELNNCIIAKESTLLNREKTADKIGYLPIYNNRYIFISDTESVKNKDNIVLWDLKQNKKQATYTRVDAGFYDDKSQVNFVDTANTLVVAENTSGSLGLIRIEASTVTGIIPFRDKNGASWSNVSISQLKKGFVVKRDDGSYHLFDDKGSELTKNGLQSEIIDYNDNVIEVKNSNGNYEIYKLDGTIVKGEFEYVLLTDNYFVCIKKGSYEINLYFYEKGFIYEEGGEPTVLNTKDLPNSFVVENGGIRLKDENGKLVEEDKNTDNTNEDENNSGDNEEKSE